MAYNTIYIYNIIFKIIILTILDRMVRLGYTLPNTYHVMLYVLYINILLCPYCRHIFSRPVIF